jgi:hypothetical protein
MFHPFRCVAACQALITACLQLEDWDRKSLGSVKHSLDKVSVRAPRASAICGEYERRADQYSVLSGWQVLSEMGGLLTVLVLGSPSYLTRAGSRRLRGALFPLSPAVSAVMNGVVGTKFAYACETARPLRLLRAVFHGISHV